MAFPHERCQSKDFHFDVILCISFSFFFITWLVHCCVHRLISFFHFRNSLFALPVIWCSSGTGKFSLLSLFQNENTKWIQYLRFALLFCLHSNRFIYLYLHWIIMNLRLFFPLFLCCIFWMPFRFEYLHFRCADHCAWCLRDWEWITVE